MMKLAKRAAALVLAAVLALSLTACSPKEAASNLILKTADLLGLREEGSDDDEADEIVAQPGGEVNFPDGLQDTSVHWNLLHAGPAGLLFSKSDCLLLPGGSRRSG